MLPIQVAVNRQTWLQINHSPTGRQRGQSCSKENHDKSQMQMNYGTTAAADGNKKHAPKAIHQAKTHPD
ncbi:MAG: hypothetical protein ACI4C3_05685 [Bacteroides sp.]